MEVAPGVFVGMLTTRVRELMWERVVELCKDGRAIMVHSARGEQRMAFRVHRHEWEPVDVDGLILMRRPAVAPPEGSVGARKGWSRASKVRRGCR